MAGGSLIINLILSVLLVFSGFNCGGISIVMAGLSVLSTGFISFAMFTVNIAAGKDNNKGCVFSALLQAFNISLGVIGVLISVFGLLNHFTVKLSVFAVSILLVTLFTKLLMYVYYRYVYRTETTFIVSEKSYLNLFDSLFAAVILILFILKVNVLNNTDGILTLIISVFMLIKGIGCFMEVLTVLLGKNEDNELLNDIAAYVMKNNMICGIHKMSFKDYGLGRRILTMHVEVLPKTDFVKLLDLVDTLEKDLAKSLKAKVTMHVDIVVGSGEAYERMKRLTDLIVKSVDETFKMYGFRMIYGPTHTNLVFDVLIPSDCMEHDRNIVKKIKEKTEALPGNIDVVVDIVRV